MAQLTCLRCGNVAEQMEKPPMRGKLGQEIFENVCTSCWQEWAAGEIMIINEYRLNLADPEHRKMLYQHMRQFFGIKE